MSQPNCQVTNVDHDEDTETCGSVTNFSSCLFLILCSLSPDSIVTNYTSSCPSLAPSCQWLFDVCPSPVFSHCGKVKSSYTWSEMYSFFVTWKNQRHMGSQTKLCKTLGQSSLNPVKLGLFQENCGEQDPYTAHKLIKWNVMFTGFWPTYFDQ